MDLAVSRESRNDEDLTVTMTRTIRRAKYLEIEDASLDMLDEVKQ